MRKTLSIALILVLLAGCTPPAPIAEPPPETPAVTGTSAPPPAFALPYYPDGGLDPLTVKAASNAALLPLLFDALFETDASFVSHPRLCLRAEADETGTVWTLFLRSDVTFSDGTPLTPELVRSCLNAYRAGDTPYSSRFADILDIRAGEGRVVLTLRSPCGNLPLLLDMPIFLSGEVPLGTGPYVLADESLLRRADWWRGEVCPLAELPLRPVHSADDVIAAFDAGQIAAVPANPTGTNALGYAGSYETREYPTSAMLYLGFQTARGACADPEVRRALALTVDRGTIVAALFSGHAAETELPVHPTAFRDTAIEDALRHHPGNAAALLDDAGWRVDDGLRRRGRETLTLTLLVSNENAFRLAAAEHIAEAMTALGADVTVHAVGWEEYLRTLSAGDFDLYLAECRLMPNFDLSALLAPDGGLNFGRYSAGELPALLADARADDKNRAALYQKIADDAPIAPIAFLNAALLIRWGRVSGAQPSQGNLFFGFERWEID